jgi:hypothetical protein
MVGKFERHCHITGFSEAAGLIRSAGPQDLKEDLKG